MSCGHPICDNSLKDIQEYNDSRCPYLECDKVCAFYNEITDDTVQNYENIDRLVTAYNNIKGKYIEYMESLSKKLARDELNQEFQYQTYIHLLSNLIYMGCMDDSEVLQELKTRYKQISTVFDEIELYQTELRTALNHCCALMTKNSDVDKYIQMISIKEYWINTDMFFTDDVNINMRCTGLFINNKIINHDNYGYQYQPHLIRNSPNSIAIYTTREHEIIYYYGIKYKLPLNDNFVLTKYIYDIFEQDMVLAYELVNEIDVFTRKCECSCYLCYYRYIDEKKPNSILSIKLPVIDVISQILFSKYWIIIYEEGTDHECCYCLYRDGFSMIYRVWISLTDMKKYTFRERDEKIHQAIEEYEDDRQREKEYINDIETERLEYDIDDECAEYEDNLELYERNRKFNKKLIYR